MRKFPLLIIIFSILILAGFIVFSSRNSNQGQNANPPVNVPFPSSGTYEFFWGDGCPHCANVEKFFDAWEASAPAKINKKEVYKNRDNSNLLLQRATLCGIAQNEIGVPLLFTPNGKCLTGDTPIIDFLKGLE